MPISAESTAVLLDRIPTPRQARPVSLLVVGVARLLLRLRLLRSRRGFAAGPVISHDSRGAAHGRANRGTFAGIAGDRAADRADRCAPRRTSHGALLLRRRGRGGLGRRSRIEAGLLRGPVVARVLIALER